MIAKQLETLLGEASHRGESEMVQRFQKLRDFGLLPTSRGKNADDLLIEQIVPAILSIVSDKPGHAGITAKILCGLLPVGGPDASFQNAPNFGSALRALLSEPTALTNVLEVRVTNSEVYKNSNGRAAIVFRDGKKEKTCYYVRKEGVSLLQPDADTTYDPRALISTAIQETVLFPKLFQTIANRIRNDKEYAS